MVQATAKGKRQRPQQRGKQVQPEQTGRLWPLGGWQWACIAILFSAAFLRLFELTAKVLHHDEGVNGLFLTNLFRNGYYHYDPANYHGPTLYYAGLITTTINALFYGKAGLSTFAIRLVTVIFGVGVVWLLLCLRRQLGAFGAIAAAALACVSPGFVFFSRYFIHEILFIFFTLAVVVAILYYNKSREPKYLMLASASLALMGATKETWIITVAVWLLALLCAIIYLKFRGSDAEPASSARVREAAQADLSSVQGSKRWLYANAALLFAVIWICLYSSFFTNFPQGLYDSFLTYTYWFKTSGNANVYDWTKYFVWLGKSELPAIALGGLGVVIALLNASSRFAVFTAFWSLGTLSAYCLIPYKTPWLELSIVLPFIIMAGYGLEQIFKYAGTRHVAVLALAVCVVFSGYQAIQLSFYRYDDDTEPYSYAHSKRDLLNLVDEINNIAAGNPAGKNIGVTVMSPEHWPLPWYLRDFPNAGYWGKVVDTHEPIIVAREDQIPEVQRTLGDKYRLYSSHDLRPGVRLYLFLRNDVQP
ncbi:MAG TPA: flippase activity-associated protein Agl23 [Terriglobales bacterium]|nr:flippase activity-associated protein Agl23 [Terriglobales bacterium]